MPPGRLGMPALVVWGLKDPYLPARFGGAYAQALDVFAVGEAGTIVHGVVRGPAIEVGIEE